ncbi:MAG: ribosome-associated translation inhibitor RaiA [Holosporales bacterium]|jgi:ribosomal subunit interface protein|nr:ribosome-associated translation inhibitor RaiA [Holosporales bacterium]
MSITISGKNIEIGESLRAFVDQEVRGAMKRSIGDFIAAHVLLKKSQSAADKHHHVFECEIDVHVASGFSIRSSGRDEDPYACVTQTTNTLKQRTKRYKARLLGQMRKQKEQALSMSQFILANAQEEDVVQDAPVIIAEMPDSMETLSIGDAVMRLDLSENPVLVFKNASSNDVNVLYKRTDGNFGWVTPKQV